jgi:AraC-like DNA-binding protein
VESVNQAVNRVIEAMYQRIGEDLTADDMARTAMYSKFHFSRVFRQVTGVSPGRFLSTLRFQEAKRLLMSTSLSVAEISNRVGYSSLGTFSTRFKSSVGVTPTEYRRGAGRWRPAPAVVPASGNGHHGWSGQPHQTVRGEVSAGVGECGPTFVGLFPDAVPHCRPVRFTVLGRPGPFLLEEVPEGTWYLVAQATAGPLGDGNLAGSVGTLGPITIRTGTATGPAEVGLRPMRPVDLPVLAAPFVTRPQGNGPWSAPAEGGYPRSRSDI